MNALLVSDFNLANLAGCLRNAFPRAELDVALAPLGQVTPSLLAEAAAGGTVRGDLLLVWTRPEAVRQRLRPSSRGDRSSEALLDEEVDVFARLVREAALGWRLVFVASWVLPAAVAGNGADTWREGSGPRRLLARAPQLNRYCAALANWRPSEFEGDLYRDEIAQKILCAWVCSVCYLVGQ
ncbi:MAG: hypothetical protein HC841_09180 [Verrucomicrobiae bacterium]|nr:hypothetical protein [Verrucomicrobiae bacterium]